MENFITGFAGHEFEMREAMLKTLGKEKYDFFFDKVGFGFLVVGSRKKRWQFYFRIRAWLPIKVADRYYPLSFSFWNTSSPKRTPSSSKSWE